MEAGALILLGLYFLPSIIASCRHHQSGGGIFVINLFFGWTVLGWVISLAWACSATGTKTITVNVNGLIQQLPQGVTIDQLQPRRREPWLLRPANVIGRGTTARSEPNDLIARLERDNNPPDETRR